MRVPSLANSFFPCLIAAAGFTQSLCPAIEFETERVIVRHTEASTAVMPADLDGDGDADLVTMISGQSTAVNWYENRARAGFLHAGVWENPAVRTTVLIADFDGDGLPDLLEQQGPTTEEDKTQVRILFGDGLAGFGSRQRELPETSIPYIFARDLNGDGKMDLLSSAGALLDAGGPAPVVISSPATVPYLSIHSAINWLDWSGDGLVDAYDEYGRWWQNLGNGTFTAAQQVFQENPDSLGWYPVRHASLPGNRGFIRCLTRVNDPNALDVVLYSFDANGEIVELDRIQIKEGGFRQVMERDEEDAVTGLGSYFRFLDESETVFEASQELLRLAVSTRDGRPVLVLQKLIKVLPENTQTVVKVDDSDDLVASASGRAPQGQFSLYRAKPRGGYVQKPVVVSPDSVPLQLEQLIDFDGDGDLDVIATEAGARIRTGSLAWWENLGRARSFRRREIYSAPGTLRVLKVQDLDSRGRPEVIAEVVHYLGNDLHDYRLLLVKSKGGGKAKVSTLYHKHNATIFGAMAGDWDGNGTMDLLIQTDRPVNDRFEMLWRQGLGGGGFASPAAMGVCRGSDELYDIGGDGFLDLVPVSRPGDPVRSWMYHDATGVREGAAPWDGGRVNAAGADLDGDEIPDYLGEGAVPLLWRGEPGSMLEARSALPQGVLHRFHDLDGDGDADAVVAIMGEANFYNSSRLIVLENSGDANFGPEVEEAAALTLSVWNEVLAGDLDGDGKTDLVACSSFFPPRISWFRGK